MAAENPSSSEDNTSQSILVQSLVYGVSAIASVWGLVQILFFIDPFLVTVLKHGVWLGILILGLPMTLFALAGLARRCGANDRLAPFQQLILRLEDGMRRQFPPPAHFAIFIFALFTIFLSTGRVQDISETDIAKEELRSLGMQFSMGSLQNALYFFDDRVVCLFHRANVRTEDIYRALGQPHAFTGQNPLLIGIFERLDEEDPDEAQKLAKRLVKLLTGKTFGGAECHGRTNDTNEDLFHSFALFYGPDLESGPGDARSLLSYALENQGGYVAAALLNERAEEKTPTLLPGARLDAPASAGEQAAVLIDPLLALARSENGRLSGGGAESARLVHALCEKSDVRPLQSTKAAPNFAIRFGDSPCLQRTPESAPNVPVLLTRDIITGTVIRRNDDESCSVATAQLEFTENAAITQPGVASREGTGRLDAEEIDVILQHMRHEQDNYVRLALTVEPLQVTHWMSIQDETLPLPARFATFSLFLEPTSRKTLVSNHAEPREIFPNNESKKTWSGRLHLGEGELITSTLFRIGHSTGVELMLEPPAADLCLRVLRNSPASNKMEMQASGEEPASRFVEAGETGMLRVPFVEKDDHIQLEVARAEPGAVDVTLTAKARNFLNCASGEKANSLNTGPPWTPGLTHEGSLAANETLRCIVVDSNLGNDEVRHVRIRLAGMSGDLDLDLLHLESDAEETTIDTSLNSGAEEEVIEATLGAGRYAIDVQSLADERSPFILTIEQSERDKLPDDEGAGPALENALELGELRVGETREVAVGLLQPGREAEFFAVDVPDAIQLNVGLRDFRSDIDLEVQDAQGEEIASSLESGNENEQISITTSAGRYYIRVYRLGATGGESYRLVIQANDPPGEPLD